MSLQEMRMIASESLFERMEKVKDLADDGIERYEVVKDRQTGEHYLHYSYIHLNVAEGGAKENFDQWMPLEYDDVLAIALGEQDYRYPERWNRKYLRNGPDQSFVWFDPGESDEFTQYERIARTLEQKLAAFKQEGRFDENSIRKLLDEFDRLDEKNERKREE